MSASQDIPSFRGRGNDAEVIREGEKEYPEMQDENKTCVLLTLNLSKSVSKNRE